MIRTVQVHCMLDLETWGTEPGCAIRSIGAVAFTTSPYLVHGTFYANVQDESCQKAGLVRDPATVSWWEQQSDAAKRRFVGNRRPLHEALGAFVEWYVAHQCAYVWANGAIFDVPVIEAAFKASNGVVDPMFALSPPWSFRDVRCHRTAMHIAKAMGVDKPLAVGTAHDALADALRQANHLGFACETGELELNLTKEEAR